MTYKLRFTNLIDRSLNYGRDQIEKFLNKAIENKHTKILDIGAGHGDDLLISRKYDKTAELYGIELFKPYADELRQKNEHGCLLCSNLPLFDSFLVGVLFEVGCQEC